MSIVVRTRAGVKIVHPDGSVLAEHPVTNGAAIDKKTEIDCNCAGFQVVVEPPDDDQYFVAVTVDREQRDLRYVSERTVITL